MPRNLAIYTIRKKIFYVQWTWEGRTKYSVEEKKNNIVMIGKKVIANDKKNIMISNGTLNRITITHKQMWNAWTFNQYGMGNREFVTTNDKKQ